MKPVTIKNALIVTPDEVKKQDLLIKNGKIADIGSFDGGDVIDGEGMYLMAGFIDTHVHGVYGVAFDDPAAEFDDALNYEASHGVTTLAATTGTQEGYNLCAAFEHIASEAKRRTRGTKIAGIHAEGPCVSPARKGAMNEKCMIKPSAEVIRKFCSHADGMMKIITIAPELEGALEAAEEAVRLGVKPSMGHTDATAPEALTAIEHGFSRVTHTCNGMRPFRHRDPGVLGVALTDDRLMCEMICDFVHLDPITVRLIFRAKGADRICLVSDTGMVSGLPDDDYRVYGKTRRSHCGAIYLEDGTLAGSWHTVLKGVQNLYSLGIPLTDITRMASVNPAKALGIENETGAVRKGLAADLVLLDSALNPVKVFIDGILQ